MVESEPLLRPPAFGSIQRQYNGLRRELRSVVEFARIPSIDRAHIEFWRIDAATGARGSEMGIRFLCPNGHRLNVKSFLAGKRGICPHCNAKFEIPFESVAAAPPPPAAARRRLLLAPRR